MEQNRLDVSRRTGKLKQNKYKNEKRGSVVGGRGKRHRKGQGGGRRPAAGGRGGNYRKVQCEFSHRKGGEEHQNRKERSPGREKKTSSNTYPHIEGGGKKTHMVPTQ